MWASTSYRTGRINGELLICSFCDKKVKIQMTQDQLLFCRRLEKGKNPWLEASNSGRGKEGYGPIPRASGRKVRGLSGTPRLRSDLGLQCGRRLWLTHSEPWKCLSLTASAWENNNHHRLGAGGVLFLSWSQETMCAWTDSLLFPCRAVEGRRGFLHWNTFPHCTISESCRCNYNIVFCYIECNRLL